MHLRFALLLLILPLLSSLCFANEAGVWNIHFQAIKQKIDVLQNRLPKIRSVDPKKLQRRPAIPLGKKPLYSRVDYSFNPVGPKFRKNLRKSLFEVARRNQIKELIVFQGATQNRFSISKQQNYPKIHETIIFAAQAIGKKKYRGFEMDTILEDTSGNLWAITGINQGRSLVMRAAKNPKPVPAPKFDTVEQGLSYLKSNFPLGSIREESSQWSIFQLRSIAFALSKLRPQEMVAVRGLHFIRVKDFPRATAARSAVYHRFNNFGSIKVSDKATRAKRSFLGSPERPILWNSMVYLHEIGHALANRYLLETHDLFIHWQRQRKIYDQIRQQLSPDQLQLIKTYNPFDILTQKEFSQFKRKNPVLASYADIPGAIDGPTKYGRESVSESFAESFALYHLDPDALKRISIATFQYFQTLQHVGF